MIHGIGVDIVAIGRIRKLLERHGRGALEKILAPSEWDDLQNHADQGRHLAKHWAAKEAFSKALGTGLRPPATLTAIALSRDRLGKPVLAFNPALQSYLDARGVTAVHLSLSDETEYAVAQVVLERNSM